MQNERITALENVTLFFDGQEVGRVQSITHSEIKQMISESFREADREIPNLEDMSNKDLKHVLLNKDY